MSNKKSQAKKEMAKDQLPGGWMKLFSVRKNRVYYFHADSGVSSWTFPEGKSMSKEEGRATTSCFGIKLKRSKMNPKLKRNQLSTRDSEKKEQDDGEHFSPSKRKKTGSSADDYLSQAIGEDINAASIDEVKRRKDSVMKKMLESQEKLKHCKEQFEKYRKKVHKLSSCETKTQWQSEKVDKVPPGNELEEGEMVSSDEKSVCKSSDDKCDSPSKRAHKSPKKHKRKKKKKETWEKEKKEEKRSPKKSKSSVNERDQKVVKEVNFRDRFENYKKEHGACKKAGVYDQDKTVSKSRDKSNLGSDSGGTAIDKESNKSGSDSGAKIEPKLQDKSDLKRKLWCVNPFSTGTGEPSKATSLPPSELDTGKQFITEFSNKIEPLGKHRKVKAKRMLPKTPLQKPSKLVAVVTSTDIPVTNTVPKQTTVKPDARPLGSWQGKATNPSATMQQSAPVVISNAATGSPYLSAFQPLHPQQRPATFDDVITRYADVGATLTSSQRKLTGSTRGPTDGDKNPRRLRMGMKPFSVKTLSQTEPKKLANPLICNKPLDSSKTKKAATVTALKRTGEAGEGHVTLATDSLGQSKSSEVSSSGFCHDLSNNNNTSKMQSVVADRSALEAMSVSRKGDALTTAETATARSRAVNADKGSLLSSSRSKSSPVDFTIGTAVGSCDRDVTAPRSMTTSPVNTPTVWQFRDGTFQAPPEQNFHQVYEKWGSYEPAREEEEEMEVSLEEIPNLSHNVSRTKGTFLVIDTNVLMGDLKYFKSLIREKQPGVGLVNVALPWPVFQELDGIKMCRRPKNKKNEELGKFSQAQDEARKAITYLNTLLEAKHPRLFCQTPTQCQESALLPGALTIEVTDDKMLNCYIQWRHLYPDHSVWFLTNDNNLRNKALVSGLQPFSVKSLKVFFENLRKSPEVTTAASTVTMDTQFIPIARQPSQHTGRVTPVNQMSCQSPPPPASVCPAAVSGGGNQNETESSRTVKKRSENDLADEMYGEISASLFRVLEVVLETEMRRIYDTIWLEIVYKKPPWSLQDILLCIQKHWIAVFGEVFFRTALTNVNCLITLFKKDTFTLEDVTSILRNALYLCSEFKRNSAYTDGVVTASVSLMSELNEVLENVDLTNILNLDEERNKCAKLRQTAVINNGVPTGGNLPLCDVTSCTSGDRSSPACDVKQNANCDITNPSASDKPALVGSSTQGSTVMHTCPRLGTDSTAPSNVNDLSSGRSMKECEGAAMQGVGSSNHLQPTDSSPVHFQVLGKGIVYYQQQFHQRLESGLLEVPERQELIRALAILCANLCLFCSTYEGVMTHGVTSESSQALCRVTNNFAREIKIQEWKDVDVMAIHSFFGDSRHRTACESGLQELRNMLSYFQHFQPYLSQDEQTAIEEFSKTYAIQ